MPNQRQRKMRAAKNAKKATEEQILVPRVIPKSKNPLQVAFDYVSLPWLPSDVMMAIDKIGAWNWNVYTRTSGPHLTYGLFTHMDPLEYPPGVNPHVDYMPDEGVSPIVITDIEGNLYKVKDLYWFPLLDVHDGIHSKQIMTKQRFFPRTLFIDEVKIVEDNGKIVKTLNWIKELINMVGVDVINNLPQAN